MTQRVYPLDNSTWVGGYIREGRPDGRGAAEPDTELEGITRENVVVGASGLVIVRDTDELVTVAPNREVAVR